MIRLDCLDHDHKLVDQKSWLINWGIMIRSLVIDELDYQREGEWYIYVIKNYLISTLITNHMVNQGDDWS